MKKKSNIDLKTLWDRASKTRKIASNSTPELESQPENETDSPSNEQQLVLVQTLNSSGTEPAANNAGPEIGAGKGPSIDTRESTDPAVDSPTTENDENEGIYDLDLLSHDPGKRIPISSYDVNEKDSVRRGYIAMGPCQPRNHDFPTRNIGGKRRFISKWFDQYNWLEYSVEKDVAFCFVCYLFKDETRFAGGDNFVNGGFKNWNTKVRFDKHVGSITSAHSEAQEKYNLFMRPRASIQESIASNSNQYKALYLSRLTYSLKCVRFLLRQGLAFRGHREGEDSLNRGNFLELLKWLAENFEEVDKMVLKNAPRNCKIIDHKIQKELINCCAKETTGLVMEDIGGDYFAILADECSDVYQQEQLALCLRYVDKKGRVVERFLGIVEVEDTTSLTLKIAIGNMLMEHSLSFSMVRGQGYDGASNMKGHSNGLKKLIMDESPSAYYVHCFAHHLQLTLVAVAKQSGDCGWFFEQLAYLLNVLGMSCKKIRMLRKAQADYIIEALELGDIETGQGQHQEMGLGRPCDTRWRSHYKTVMHVLSLYPSIHQVLIKIGEEYSSKEAIAAQTMLTSFESFEFVFMAKLMLTIFSCTDDLSTALRKRDQDIVNIISLLYVTKEELQNLREDDGWRDFLKEVISFCVKRHIKVVDMDDFYKPVGRSSRFFKKVKNLHCFHVDMFLGVIDRQLRELNDRFDEVNTELLICMASFSPVDSFAAYDKEKLIQLAHFYPKDFSKSELLHLPYQLANFVGDMRTDQRFRVSYVKNELRNRMGEQFLNDCLVTFLEKEFFLQVKDDAIISCFQAKGGRKVVL